MWRRLRSDGNVPAPFDAKRSALVVAKNGDNLKELLARGAASNCRYTAAFSIDIEKLQERVGL